MKMTVEEAQRVLGVDAMADRDILAAARRHLMSQYHHDRFRGMPTDIQTMAAQRRERIEAAYNKLETEQPKSSPPVDPKYAEEDGDGYLFEEDDDVSHHEYVAWVTETCSRHVFSKLDGQFFPDLGRQVTPNDSLQSLDGVFVWPDVPAEKLMVARTFTDRTYSREDIALLFIDSSIVIHRGFCVTADGRLHWKNELRAQKSIGFRDIRSIENRGRTLVLLGDHRLVINGEHALEISDCRDKITVEIVLHILDALQAYFCAAER